MSEPTAAYPSRRTVLRGAVVAAAAAALPTALPRAAGALTARLGPTLLRRGVFRPHVGTSFLLTSGSESTLATLVAVGDDRIPGETRFSLLFEMADGARPADGIFAVSHPLLRAVDLYVGAVGDPAAGRYEAVVNA